MKKKTMDLPCYINDVVYVLYEDLPLPARRRVTDIHIDGQGIIVTVRNDRTGHLGKYFVWEFGSKVFTDYDMAYDALKKGKGGHEMNRLCSYDEGYDIYDAAEIGWCAKCECDSTCPMKKKNSKRSKNCSWCDGGFGDNTMEFRRRKYRFCPYCGRALK